MATLAAEFPNDNPLLHRGSVWVCLEPVGAAVAERAASLASEAEDEAPEPELETPAMPAPRISGIVAAGTHDDDDLLEGEGQLTAIVIEELEPVESVSVEGLVASEEPPREDVAANDFAATALPPPPDDPFVVLLSTLADVAIGAGSPNVAALLPGLLLDGAMDGALPDEAVRGLEEAGVCRDGVVTPTFVATTRAWQAILRGTSDDFSPCGAAMLDEWAAGLLARLLGAPLHMPRLRAELRARGVAAFGLIEAA